MKFGIFEGLQLIGALGFFIYGMKVMSEGIQKVAGSKMRQILSAMTSNRIKGVITGFTLTGLVQSSSATTVMVVSFVNAGLLSLTESIGVIMGANIGTTITAWLISIVGFKVKIASIALPIIALGFPLLFVSKSKVKAWGEVLIGFALLFIGLNELKGSVPDLKSNPEILEFLASYTDMGMISLLLFIGIGTLLTITVQSSSAAMALTLVMANQGWIPFELAAAMVLGENIGTTITANLAAMIGNIHAKRAARAHFIFNIFGVVWMILVFGLFITGIDNYMQSTRGVSPLDPEQYASIPIALSFFHTSFNIINTLLLVGFVNFIAKIVIKMVPSKGDDEEYHLEHIGLNMIKTPDISILEARKEIAKFGMLTSKMSGIVRELIEKKKIGKINKLVERVKNYEEITDRIEVEIATFLSKVSEGNISEESSFKIRGLLSINNDMERIGDIFYQLSLAISRKQEDKLWFTDGQMAGLYEMFTLVDEALAIMNKNLESDYSKVTIDESLAKEREINAKRNDLRRKHLGKIEKGEYDIKSGLIYSDIFNLLERVGDHVINVTEGIVGEV
ncbi:MAG: Na/Pi cotransporter family protein [Cyclobacteriaceae bacterium]|nr:Na/Pi cotransporter family protein [Cyclobacteriaceae bacterium]